VFNNQIKTIETQRLLLRPWKKEDLFPYFQLNQDPKVLEFLPGPLWLCNNISVKVIS